MPAYLLKTGFPALDFWPCWHSAFFICWARLMDGFANDTTAHVEYIRYLLAHKTLPQDFAGIRRAPPARLLCARRSFLRHGRTVGGSCCMVCGALVFYEFVYCFYCFFPPDTKPFSYPKNSLPGRSVTCFVLACRVNWQARASRAISPYTPP